MNHDEPSPEIDGGNTETSAVESAVSRETGAPPAPMTQGSGVGAWEDAPSVGGTGTQMSNLLHGSGNSSTHDEADHAPGAHPPDSTLLPTPRTDDHDGAQSTVNTLDPDEQRRAALVQSLPSVDDDTPLMAQLQQDARRRIELRGRRFPRPDQTRVITVANQKGGVGKTTTTVNMAAALAQAGLNVLVLDNDPQGNASTALGIDHRAGTPSIYEVLVESAPMADAVQQSADIPNLWCLPATIDLSGAEIELVSMVARETRLRNALDAYLQQRIDSGQERIDYVLVDCPPSLGLLTVNAFVVAREVLIPIQCEYYALEGLSQLLKTIQLIQAHLNPDLHVSTILLTMYDARTNLAQQVATEVRTHFPERTLRTTVPRSVRISEAPSYGQTVMTYDPGSSGALAYLEAARELAERGVGTTEDTNIGETPAYGQPVVAATVTQEEQ
ncbi:ParA family protein [Cellulomonas soli]|uniref:ParA family protein n=1 Tax=Cellulomonas soli TaxID=931535 RepID=UPI003F831C73